MSDTDSLSPKEVARNVGCPISSVRKAILRGELAAYRLNARVVLITRSAVARWLDACQAAARLKVIRCGQRGRSGRRKSGPKAHNSA